MYNQTIMGIEMLFLRSFFSKVIWRQQQQQKLKEFFLELLASGCFLMQKSEVETWRVLE